MATLAWVLGGLLFLVIILMNQLPEGEPPKAPGDQGITAPSIADPFTLSSKMMVKLRRAEIPMDPASERQINAQIEIAATTPLDKVRGAMALGEIEGPQAGLRLLDRISQLELDQNEALRDDAALVRTMLVDGPGALDDAARARLVEHHGWFGEVALTRDEPTNPKRARLLGGGGLVLTLAGVVMLLFVVGGIGGLTCAILAFVLAGRRRHRKAFEPPAPGGSVYLEMVALLIACFAGMKVILPLVLGLVGVTEPKTAITVSLGFQWVLVLVLFWPLVRGVSVARWKADLGLHTGRGLMREVGAGLFLYMAGLPLLGAAVGLSFVLTLLKQLVMKSMTGEEPTTPTNPVLDLVANAGWGQILMFALLATVWAPLVEETIFRGALFRHLRSRLGVLLSVIGSALVFGLMHGYELLLLGPVISLGVVFACMREWRGSLIPSMLAHALHNGTVTLILMLLIVAVRD